MLAECSIKPQGRETPRGNSREAREHKRSSSPLCATECFVNISRMAIDSSLLDELFVIVATAQYDFAGIFQPTHDIDDLLLHLLNRGYLDRPEVIHLFGQ